MSANDSVRITLTSDEIAYHEQGETNLENLDFEAQRNLIVDLITSMTDNIKERDKLRRDKTSHPLSHIKMSTKLESQILAAYNHLDVLKNIYSKISKSGKKRGKYTDANMSSFQDTLVNLEENLLTLENSIRYTNNQMIKKSKANLDLDSANFDHNKLSSQEYDFVAESIKRWNERDEYFDDQLKEIGESVDRIGQMATRIGQRAKEQAQVAIETAYQVENTTKGVSEVTLRINKALKRQRLFEFYIRLILIVIVLILAGVLIYMIIRKLRK